MILPVKNDDDRGRSREAILDVQMSVIVMASATS